MLRNWVTQFGYAPGDQAGDERIPNEDRAKFISQIGNFFGWNPPPGMSWMVEVTKDLKGKHPGKYVMCFFRYATDAEAEKMLGTNYENLLLIIRAKKFFSFRVGCITEKTYYIFSRMLTF